ncbi:hypothetical protein HK100_005665 [Physocladia obscura]|uniref:NADP-dependent oxidoreductase domain-containing protein n=1 Tax=Physocladia obscura TaxID=109957 RepID=A0AAD5XKK3_9FUNG|nr:hypothetical protein HK100_005665 [Physocladia obscura]
MAAVTGLPVKGFKPHVILGTMTFGVGVGGRISDLATVQKILNVFKAHGHFELDTARMYCEGNTEETLSKLDVQTAQGFAVHTKAYPFTPGDHLPERLTAMFDRSLSALNTKRVEVFYLHAPDHTVPFVDTLVAVNELYKQGRFVEFGLSNYAAWEVMQIDAICVAKGYVRPTIYQGMYNALTRDVEPELLPCLRALGIRFYAYNPLCGGLLSGFHKFDEDVEGTGARFDPKTSQGARYRGRYWNNTYFTAVELVKRAIANHDGLTLISASHRWMFHHSKIDQSKGDGVIIGVSSVAHAEQNLTDCEGGPLPADVVSAFDEAYNLTKTLQPNYFR